VRAQGPYVYVAVDGTSLSVPGASNKPRDKGGAAGPCGQHLWARKGRRKKPTASQPLEDKETRLFEEANWFGVKAAERALKGLGRVGLSWL